MSHRNKFLPQVVFIPFNFILGVGLILGLLGSDSLLVRASGPASPESPSDALVVPASIFGVELSHITPGNGLVEMADAGAYWVRPRGVYWSEVQPVEGQAPDWSVLSGLEQELQNAADQGMQVILVVRSTPDWAQQIPGVACGPIASDKLASFGDFMFQLVNRYKDQVTYWELWNEPDVDPNLVLPNSPYGCWGDESDQYYGGGYYAEMLKAVYPRIKQADTNAQVLVGGLVLDCDPVNVCPQQASGKFLDGILQNDGGSYFDGVSFHAYDYYLGELGKYFNDKWQASWDTTGPVGAVKANYLKSTLSNAGIPEKYLINTEASVFCDVGCDSVFEATKAFYLAESFGGAFSSGLLGNVWFAALSGYRNTDLLDSTLTPKPAYFAYKFGQSKLYNAAYVEVIDEFPGVMGYEFRRSDCPTAGEICRFWMLWSLDGNEHMIELPAAPFGIYGVDGSAMDADPVIAVTLEPTYIELPLQFRIQLPAVLQGYQTLQNGDFEDGAGSQGNPPGWLAYSGGQEGLQYSLVSSNPSYPVVDTAIPSGNYSMLLGSPDYPCSSGGIPLGFAAIEQTFTVPEAQDGTPLHLVFDYVIYTQDGASGPNFDRFEVYLDDGSGQALVYQDGRIDHDVDCSQWYRLPDTGWHQGSIDLLQPVDYRGKTITVSFQNWNRYDHYFNTLTYLDNVNIVGGN